MNNKEAIYIPAEFPVGGRMHLPYQAIRDNISRQEEEIHSYRSALNAQRLGSGTGLCAENIHISLCFDGTGNNQYNDSSAQPPYHSNIARISNVSLAAPEHGYFRYYIPGVGTPFPEIGELDYSGTSLAFATGGMNRINWALLSIVDALLQNYTGDPLGVSRARTALAGMDNKDNRAHVLRGLLAPLHSKVLYHLPQVITIKLYVYGFSRGAAEARVFVNWLSELFEVPPGRTLPQQTLLGIPVSVEFLGILDTVASVGVSHMLPMFSGHLGWADGTMPLPDAKRFPGFIRQCRHFVAAHEQRASFPLDSVRNEDGTYPPNTLEVVYPGMHSDVGGGYPIGEQGKALAEQGELLSQIVLQDLYVAAFTQGAPLLAPYSIDDSPHQPFLRAMEAEQLQEFDVSPTLIKRFNAWRLTLDVGTTEAPTTSDAHEPLRSGRALEAVLAEQTEWLTAWRIERYAGGTYAQQLFYRNATEHSAAEVQANTAVHKAYVEALQAQRAQAKHAYAVARARNPKAEQPLELPSKPAYVPARERTQLGQAAVEFKRDFEQKERPYSGLGTLADWAGSEVVLLLNDDDEAEEYARMCRGARLLHLRMFPRWAPAKPTALDHAMPQIVALFDDHIHDSRAVFLHDLLGSRELWTGYLLYRMAYFGERCSKALTPAVIASKVVGVWTLVPIPVSKTAFRKTAVELLTSTFEKIGIGYEVVEADTGRAIQFAPNAADVLRPTHFISRVVREQRLLMLKAEQLQRREAAHEALMKLGVQLQRFEPASPERAGATSEVAP